MSKNKKGFETRSIHSGQSSDPSTGAVMTPIYATSTYEQEGPGEHKGYEYSRSANPTRKALEECIADLENGGSGHAFASGMAATSTIIDLLDSGDHIVACDDLYGGTYRLFENVKKRTSGIQCDFVDFSDPKNIENAINEKTKMIWLETPTNPLLKVIDLGTITDLIKGRDIIAVCDNTFCSPWVQKPLNQGFDIVMHSATKYLGGHSDVVMGCLMLNDEVLDEKLRTLQNSCGAIAGPMDSFLVLRGIKTLHLRMLRHSENGKAVVDYLSSHPKVEKVFWPGLESHPGHQIAKKQMTEFGGMISFIIKGDNMENAHKFVESVKIFTLAESLGGVESLVGHPATMTHASIPKEVREKVGVTDGLIRLSVGIEDPRDLLADLKQALSLCRSCRKGGAA